MAAKKNAEQPLHPEMPPSDEELARHAALGVPLRRCAGSARFGIEPHEAPVEDFPKQPSRKDGLGTMCTEHWRAYVKGLREARMAAAGGRTPSAARSVERAAKKPARPKATKASTKRERRRTPMAHLPAKPPARAVEAAAAEALIAEVDALPADEHVKRVGDADVQAALETSAMGRMLAD